jgi:hypothetical protein
MMFSPQWKNGRYIHWVFFPGVTFIRDETTKSSRGASTKIYAPQGLLIRFRPRNVLKTAHPLPFNNTKSLFTEIDNE